MQEECEAEAKSDQLSVITTVIQGIQVVAPKLLSEEQLLNFYMNLELDCQDDFVDSFIQVSNHFRTGFDTTIMDTCDVLYTIFPQLVFSINRHCTFKLILFVFKWRYHWSGYLKYGTPPRNPPFPSNNTPSKLLV